MKTLRWLCGIAVVLFGAFGFLSKAIAAGPPWPPLVLAIATDPDAAEEGSGPGQFLIVRVGPANMPLTVQYALGGTASNGVDYEPLTGEVTIPIGAFFAPVDVNPIDDFLIEGRESVVLALQQPPVWPPPYIVTWPSVAGVEIADNDLEPTNHPPTVVIVGPPDGSIFDAYEDIRLVARAYDRDGRVRMVEFFDGTNSIGTVTNRPRLAAADLVAKAEDPVFDLDSEVFPDLGLVAGSGPIPIPAPGDLFKLVWPNAPPGHHIITAVATDNDGDSTRSAAIEITVQEPPPVPVVNIRASDPIATEPDPTSDHLDTATFTVYRRGPTNEPLRVFYRVGGTASNGVDYSAMPHSVDVAAGERRANVIVKPLDDLLVEGTESVVLQLIEPPGCDDPTPSPGCYALGRSHIARATIRDNDTANRPPVVRLVKPEDGDVFVAPAYVRLAALARDYDGYVAAVEFFEGTNSLGIVTNHPTADSVFRPSFSLVWSNVPPGHYVLHAVATDNDGESMRSKPVEIKVVPQVFPPVVNIVATDPEAAETGPLIDAPPNTATFRVSRTGPTNWPLVVFYRIGGSAENGRDYQRIPNRIEIPAGADSADVTIEPIDDNLVEGVETVVLKLDHPPILSPTPGAPTWWYRIGSNYLAKAIIRDNDFPPTNLPPRVVIVHPEDGDVFRVPTDIKLVALAHDPDGWVRTVEFFDGNVSLGVVSNSLSSAGGNDGNRISPEQLFRLLWEKVPPGLHVLTAKATDNRGAASTSDPVRIKVLPPPCPPVVTIYATDPYACEGDLMDLMPIRAGLSNDGGPIGMDPRPDPRPKTATFTVIREGCTDNDLTVYYKLDGTAQNGVDYRRLAGQVVIPRGATRARIIVDPMDDNLPEPTETVIATVVPPVCIAIYPPPPDCYRVGDPHRAVVYIFDNDRNLSPKVEIVHPQNGDIFRAGADIPIDVAALDPDGWVSTVEFFANHTKIGEQHIDFIIPPPPGQLQKFSMIWSNVPAGAYVLEARATDDKGALALTDPVNIKVAYLPPAPVVTIEAVDPLASEPNPLAANPMLDTALFKVSRAGSADRPLTVFYRIGGTASNGVDYLELSGVVTIPSNAPSAFIQIVPQDDQLVEGTESVIVALLQPPCVLSNAITPDCYLVGNPGRSLACLRDNDLPNRPPTVTIVSPPNGAVFSVPLDLRLVAAAGDPDGWVVAVEFFDGDQSLGVVKNPITILDEAPVRLPDLNTDVLTANSLLQPFSLIWSNVPPGKHVLTAVATDNAGDSTRSRPIEIAVREVGEPPVVRIMATDAVAREGMENTATFRIVRTGPTNSALTVFYNIRGTASNGVDYVMIPNSLTIPAGRHGARIIIAPIDDNLLERIETVRLHLLPAPFGPVTYEIGHPARAGAVILDNDHPLLAQERLADGLHLRFSAFEGTPFRLESSKDLIHWEEEASDISSEDGVSVVEETGESAARFFRVVPEYGDLDLD